MSKGEATATPTMPEAFTPEVDAVLAATREKIEAQLEELRPQAEAFHRLEDMIANWDALATGKFSSKGRSGTRAPRGSRSDEFVRLVRASGENGISVAEAADQMDGINPNYLYRLAKELTESKAISKTDDKRYIVAPE